MQIRIALTRAVFFALMSGMVSVAATPQHADDYATHLVRLINQYRQQHHLPPLRPDARLTSLAQAHVLAMAQEQQLSHDGFDTRFKRAHRTRCVENVGWNYPRAEDQLAGWRASADHNENLLNAQVHSVGIAVFQGYVTYFACSA